MKKYSSFSCAETNEYSIGMYYSIYNLYTAINHQDPYIPITFICHCCWEGKCPKKKTTTAKTTKEIQSSIKSKNVEKKILSCKMSSKSEKSDIPERYQLPRLHPLNLPLRNPSTQDAGVLKSRYRLQSQRHWWQPNTLVRRENQGKIWGLIGWVNNTNVKLQCTNYFWVWNIYC